jgi:hypothetical protein
VTATLAIAKHIAPWADWKKAFADAALADASLDLACFNTALGFFRRSGPKFKRALQTQRSWHFGLIGGFRCASFLLHHHHTDEG